MQLAIFILAILGSSSAVLGQDCPTCKVGVIKLGGYLVVNQDFIGWEEEIILKNL